MNGCNIAHGLRSRFCATEIIDGASVMLGRKSEVGTRLTQKYPNLITWHCLKF